MVTIETKHFDKERKKLLQVKAHGQEDADDISADRDR